MTTVLSVLAALAALLTTLLAPMQHDPTPHDDTSNFTPTVLLDTSQVMDQSESRIGHMFMADDALFTIAAEFSSDDPRISVSCNPITERCDAWVRGEWS